MSHQDITFPVLTDVHLITCIVQRGRADTVVKAAMNAGAEGATIHFAKGTGISRKQLGLWSIATNAEKEIITIAVSGEQLDVVFERMYLAGDLETPGMGFMYVTPLEKAATYIPEDLLQSMEADKE
jgi:nitrogen regulatory protein PII